MRRLTSKSIKAFTLVEIMIVVAIIELLATILIPNLVRVRINSNDTMAQSTLKTLGTAMENYAASNDSYPGTMTELRNITPPYVDEDFFTGTHGGFTYTANLSAYTYTITAEPAGSNLGSHSYTITTGSVLVEN